MARAISRLVNTYIHIDFRLSIMGSKIRKVNTQPVYELLQLGILTSEVLIVALSFRPMTLTKNEWR